MTKLNADRMTYREAVKISKMLPYYNYLLPAGSVASKQPFPQDLDFITFLDLDLLYDAFYEKFPDQWLKRRLGKKRFDYFPIINGKKIVINIWRANPENLSFFYFTYGYPRQFVIAMRRKAKLMGYKLNQYGLYEDGVKLDITKLDDIFKALDLPFRTPEEQYLKHKKK